MQSQLIKLRDALVSIENLKVYHYWHPRLEAPYCIWAEEGEGDSIWASNHLHEQVIAGSVDYFTKLEFDPVVDEIQEKLNEVECLGWQLESVLYEDETNLIHFTWSFEIA